MTRKIVVHSNKKRFVQVILGALLIAAALTGLKKVAAWKDALATAEDIPAAVGTAAPDLTAEAENIIAGRGSVIDGDTLDVYGVRIRLEGIDAPESSQRCGSAGNEWPCGHEAARALSDWLGDRTVSCRTLGQDRYQRILARCFVDTEDIQAWLVLNGWALAYRQYSTDYVAAEEVAQSRRSGLWKDEFTPPWEWRGPNE